MSKDDLTRLNDTLAYVEHLPALSPVHVQALRLAKANDIAASQRISLGFRWFSNDARETERRRALRALLLCLDWDGGSAQLGDARHAYQNAPIEDIADAVSSFFPLANVSAKSVIDTARGYDPAIGQRNGTGHDRYLLRRGAVRAKQKSMGGNCYDGVTTWLYLSGAVSLRWLRVHGGQPGGQLPTWGAWGPPIQTPAQAQTIPSGRICRLEKPARLGGGLHYVLTVALGRCKGLNQSSNVVHDWDVDRFGKAPGIDSSEFPLAGYLAGMEPGSIIRTTSCLPTAPL